MKTKFEDIVDVTAIGGKNTKQMNEVLRLASQEVLTPAKNNTERVLVVGIDYQNDFMDQGELGVPGAHQDVERFTKFVYNNLENIYRIAVSIDTHQPHQIFHPAWWVDKQGNQPPAFTVITLDDVDQGTWIPVLYPKESYEYVQKLKEVGKKDLIVWNYHCLQGTFGAALEGQIGNMVYFHSVAKKSIPERIVKGQDPLSEMYGIIKPEYDRKGYVNLAFLNEIETYDKIVIAGEAKSHCVLESIQQILDHYANRPEVTSKIYVLEDCMSSIPGFEANTEQAFDDFKTKYRVNVARSTELVL